MPSKQTKTNIKKTPAKKTPAKNLTSSKLTQIAAGYLLASANAKKRE